MVTDDCRQIIQGVQKNSKPLSSIMIKSY